MQVVPSWLPRWAEMACGHVQKVGGGSKDYSRLWCWQCRQWRKLEIIQSVPIKA